MTDLIQRHELKTSPGYFQQVWQGAKTFEIRYDDRGYQRGDQVVLQEYDAYASCTCPGKNHPFVNCERFTGRVIEATIGCVVGQMPSRGSQRGFSGMGYVVFSLVGPEKQAFELEER